MPLQVLHVLRALEFKAKDERIVVLNEMGSRIGQGSFTSPSVFNFYLPEYQPHGTHQLSEHIYPWIYAWGHACVLPAKSVIYFNLRVTLL